MMVNLQKKNECKSDKAVHSSYAIVWPEYNGALGIKKIIKKKNN